MLQYCKFVPVITQKADLRAAIVKQCCHHTCRKTSRGRKFFQGILAKPVLASLQEMELRWSQVAHRW